MSEREEEGDDLRLGDELLPRQECRARGAFAAELEFSSADLERWLAPSARSAVQPAGPALAPRAAPAACGDAQLSLFDLSQRQD